jgi:hypothetical protein
MDYRRTRLGWAAHAIWVIDRESGAVADRFEVAQDAAGLRARARSWPAAACQLTCRSPSNPLD